MATGWSEEELEALEAEHAEGMSVQQVVAAFTSRGQRLSEATFRKYVQLGLLPRSVRVARAGRGRGSRGVYPATVVRQIDSIRRLMRQGHTMEEIQRDFLFIRGPLEELERQLEAIYGAVTSAIATRGEYSDAIATRQLEEAREYGGKLVAVLDAIEKRMSMRARMARAVV